LPAKRPSQDHTRAGNWLRLHGHLDMLIDDIQNSKGHLCRNVHADE
jgi:hypothetical protein